MKKIFIVLILCGLTFITKGQEASVEKNSYGIQSGILGVWIHNETRLTNEISLRSEIGFDGNIYYNYYYGLSDYITILPVITVEPRWYYNLEKRLAKSKNTENNSGNFISMKISYNPDWFYISNYDRNFTIVNEVCLIPKWGIRRVYGKHFSFETGIGIGYRYIFDKSAGYYENNGDFEVDLHFRIGYSF
jgi:hypothetical protein